jgi:SAM-dependent methyltransferase
MKDDTVNHSASGFDLPSPWVCRHAGKIPSSGRVLDLACGQGRHSRYLAATGFRVLAVDRDPALRVQSTTVEFACHDLEQGVWPLGSEAFAGIVVTRYLFRPLLPRLASALAPGGVLIYETFMQGNAAFGRPARPEFLLVPGELEVFARDAGLEVLDFAEGFQATPRPAMLQSICARRPG